MVPPPPPPPPPPPAGLVASLKSVFRFDQVEGVTDEERDRAWARIEAAARKYGVHVSEGDWRDLAEHGKDTK